MLLLAVGVGACSPLPPEPAPEMDSEVKDEEPPTEENPADQAPAEKAPAKAGPAPADSSPAPTGDPILRFAGADEALLKHGGAAVEGNWVCDSETCRPGIIQYGPYTEEVPGGWHSAVFEFDIEGIERPDSATVKFEVFDAASKQVFAKIQKRGAHLKGDGPERIQLDFESPGTSKLEFRTLWNGDGVIKLQSIAVY